MDLRKLCGVDISQLVDIRAEGDESIVVGAWMRNAMGLKTSPYNYIKGSLRAKRIVLGDPKDRST